MSDAWNRPPIECSQGGIPFNKWHLDEKDARIATLEARVKELEGALHFARKRIAEDCETMNELSRIYEQHMGSTELRQAREQQAGADKATFAIIDEAIRRAAHVLATEKTDG